MNTYLINLLNCISYFTFFYVFFKDIAHSKFLSTLIIITESALIYSLIYQHVHGIAFDILTLFIHFVFQLYLFDDNHHSKTAIIAIFTLFLNLIHSLFISVLTITFIPVLHISIKSDAAIALLQMLCLYAFYIFAKYLRSRKKVINTSALSDFFMILFVPFLMSYFIQYLYYQYRSVELLLLLFFSILLDIVMIIILINKIHDLETIEHERIASAILVQTEKQFQTVLINENRIRKIRHDMKNHITALQSLCSEQKFNEVSVYLKHLSETVNVSTAKVYCNNVYLNTILNSKIEQHRHIHFNITVLSFPSGIDDIDFCIMITNLMDNAITELDTHPELNKNIALNIYTKGNFQFIVIQNPLSHNKTLITEKGDILNHGLGLSIVQDIVDKYNGQLLIHQDRLFTVSIMFPIMTNIP